MKLSMAVRVAVLIVGCLSLPACPTLSNSNQSCTTHESCGAGLYCVQGACQKLSPEERGLASHCFNQIKDEGESDIDCGGTCPANFKCRNDKACRQESDCASNFCKDNVCKTLPAACFDNKENNNESDQDCGGSDCKACADGKACRKSDDCESRVCKDDKCQAPDCKDSVKNGSESDVDCGGKCAMLCPVHNSCLKDQDCVTGNCNAETLKCQSASCTDGKLNPSTETDVDCGGTCSFKCSAGKKCNEGEHCTSGSCVNNRCAECSSAGNCAVNDCQSAQCVNNRCVLSSKEENTTCPGGFCDGTGACVQCNSAAQCPAPKPNHECLSVSCTTDKKCVIQAVAAQDPCKGESGMCNGNLQYPACTPCVADSNCPLNKPKCIATGTPGLNQCVCVPIPADQLCKNRCGQVVDNCGKSITCASGPNPDGCSQDQTCVNTYCECNALPACPAAPTAVCKIHNACSTKSCVSCSDLSAEAKCNNTIGSETRCTCTNRCAPGLKPYLFNDCLCAP